MASRSFKKIDMFESIQVDLLSRPFKTMHVVEKIQDEALGTLQNDTSSREHSSRSRTASRSFKKTNMFESTQVDLLSRPSKTIDVVESSQVEGLICRRSLAVGVLA